MKSQLTRLSGQAALLGLLAALPACSGSSDGSSGGEMFVISCSLGCDNGSSNSDIGCSLVNIGQNAEIVIQFSEPVSLSSVTANSFRLINLNDGTVPSGVYTLDPADARRLIFRPSLEFVGPGNPEWGFDPGQTYQLLILGEGGATSGSYIRSTSGKNNSTTLDCTVQTTEPLIDPVPGPPSVTAYVTSTLTPDGEVIFDPVTNLPVGGAPLDGASSVPTECRVVLIFNDIMNKATVANQQTGNSNTMTVLIDPDGDLNTADQVQWAGSWNVDVDFDNLLRTTAVFTPTGGEFPSGGDDPNNPRLIVVDITNQLLDVVGNPLDNPTQAVWSTTTQPVEEVVITEDFTTTDSYDTDRSSKDSWGVGTPPRVVPGTGGGSGRLGEFVVPAGEQVTLDTDSQTFPLVEQTIPLMTNEVPGTDYDPLDQNTWPTLTIDPLSAPADAFEFSRIDIDGTLVVTGSQPLRLFSRGEAIIDGLIDLTGSTPAPHTSNSGGDQASNPGDGQETADGGPGGAGGPGAGAGGQGADRMDQTNASLPVMINVGGILNPGAVNTGRDGGGVGNLPNGAGGVGGPNWPPTLPANASPSSPDYGDAELSVIVDDGNTCRIAMVGGPGSGGSHALQGGVGQGISPFAPVFPGTLANAPAPTPGGDNSGLDLEAPGSAPSGSNKRNLEFWRKHLRGGSGGGGGGTHLFGSRMNGASGPTCSQNGLLFPFWDHSGAGGGGGGGTVQIAAGLSLAVNNLINCSGGNGGSSTVPGAPIELCTSSGQSGGGQPDCEKYAAPGGGGSGGSVRLQAPTVTLANQPGRIDVNGGGGGLGVGNSVGGTGSPGLVRIEFLEGFVDEATAAQTYAPLITPVDPGNPDFNNPFPSAAILSVGRWENLLDPSNPDFFITRPESFSGTQSCWLEPQVSGAVFGLDFVSDDLAEPDLALQYGWNMDIVYDVPGVGERIFPYRGIPTAGDGYDEVNYPSTELGGDDFQTYLGNSLNHDQPSLSSGSYLCIRFQGVRTASTPADLCALDLFGAGVEPDTLTPWVQHPDQLNQFSPQPNLVRFAVIFDQQLKRFDPAVAANIRGVTNLRIRVQPL